MFPSGLCLIDRLNIEAIEGENSGANVLSIHAAIPSGQATELQSGAWFGAIELQLPQVRCRNNIGMCCLYTCSCLHLQVQYYLIEDDRQRDCIYTKRRVSNIASMLHAVSIDTPGHV